MIRFIKLRINFLLVAILLVSQLVHAQADLCSSSKIRYGRNLERTKRAAIYRQLNTYDLKYHRLAFRVDPDTLYISGSVTSFFVPKSNISSFYMELADVMIIDSVVYRNNTVRFSRLPNDMFRVDFTQTLPAGHLDSLSVYYHGNPPQDGFGSFVKASHSGGIPIIWTLSEPYGARDWWPCKQSLDDKIDSIDVFVNCPYPYKAASNGLLVSSIKKGNRMIHHWKHQYPIPAYLIAIAVTDYVAMSNMVIYKNDSFPILNYVFPEDSALARTQVPRTVDIMKIYIDKYGSYPFKKEKYGHAQFGWGGGMEHQTMSFMGGFSEFLVAHELAHQWFGDKVTCNSWSDIWLNEGFATYSEGVFMQATRSEESFTKWRSDRVNSITRYPDGSVYIYASDTQEVSRVFNYRLTYQKAAMVIHMLRKIVGDSVFFPMLQTYLNQPGFAYDYASTEGFKNLAEEFSGLDLEHFFDAWIYGEGHPSFDVNWRQIGQVVYLWVGQKGSALQTPDFYASLDIELQGDQKDTTVSFVIDSSYSGRFIIPFDIKKVVVDPNFNLISSNNVVTNLGADFNTDLGFWLFPNPFTRGERITVIALGTEQFTEINIYNISGQLVRTLELKGAEQSVVTFDMQGFRPGVYIVQAKGDKNYVHRVVKL